MCVLPLTYKYGLLKVMWWILFQHYFATKYIYRIFGQILVTEPISALWWRWNRAIRYWMIGCDSDSFDECFTCVVFMWIKYRMFASIRSLRAFIIHQVHVLFYHTRSIYGLFVYVAMCVCVCLTLRLQENVCERKSRCECNWAATHKKRISSLRMLHKFTICDFIASVFSIGYVTSIWYNSSI